MSKNINSIRLSTTKNTPAASILKEIEEMKKILKEGNNMKFINGHLKFIWKYMIEYQKLNNTKRHCIDNAQYYRDCISNLPGNIEVRAVLGHCKQTRQNRTFIVVSHLVVVYDNKIIDPSYEIFKLKPNYYFTLKDFVESVPLDQGFQNGKLSKEQVKEHLDFVELAEKINNQSLALPLAAQSDISLEYYNNQADYVEECCDNKPMYK